MHFKKNNNREVKTYLQGLRPLQNYFPKNLKKILKNGGFYYSEILTKWKLLVGSEISKVSYPKSLRMSNNRGTLILAIERGSEINIEYSKNNIINKINSFFGYNLINKIQLVTFSNTIKQTENKNKILAKNKYDELEKKIKNIKHKKIQNSLLNLIKTIKK